MGSADENLTPHSFSSSSSSFVAREDDYDQSLEDGYADFVNQSYHQHHFHNPPSRLSMCTSNSTVGHDAEYSAIDDSDFDGDGISTFVAGLSLESFDADNEEFSDELEDHVAGESYWDSDDEKKTTEFCHRSLPATPPPRWMRKKCTGIEAPKEYASENEAQKPLTVRKRRNIHRTRRLGFRSKEFGNQLDEGENENHILSDHSASFKNYSFNNSFSGAESEIGGGGGSSGGLVVITRPKGGRRSLCLDFEEVKACKDLGFELEHQQMFEIMPSRLSLSASTLDTATTCSSGGNSPIANWRISSPGDDPRDVKARLKVWAQAVALASTSRQAC